MTQRPNRPPSELKSNILSTAETLVAREGWKACTTRQVGKAMGISHGPVHDNYPGYALEESLIEAAYANIISAVTIAVTHSSSMRDLILNVAGHIRSDRDVVGLMVQVISLFAAIDAESGSQLRDKITDVRDRASDFIRQDLEGSSLGELGSDLNATSVALIAWFEAACTVNVMQQTASVADLTGVARGFEDLRWHL